MNYPLVRVRKLAGWGLDEYEFRPEMLNGTWKSRSAHHVARQASFQQGDVLVDQATAQLHEALSPHILRADVLAGMSGLSWSLGVVDLRPMIAFQRRLSVDPELPQIPTPPVGDWSSLLAYAFGTARPVECEMIHDVSARTLILHAGDPNLQFRITNNAEFPLSIHTGSPFFEVACFRGRWFLRDGYHRAYGLLKAGLFEVPAVIIQARTIEELGANQRWFFSEEVLFSADPPCVMDFLDDSLVFEYVRPPLIKTLRMTMEETLTISTFLGEHYEHCN